MNKWDLGEVKLTELPVSHIDKSKIRGGYADRETRFMNIKIGDIIVLSALCVKNETPKVGERCLTNKMFRCIEVRTKRDCAMDRIQSDMEANLRKWQRLLLRIAFRAKKYNEAMYYKFVFVGAEDDHGEENAATER